MRSIDEVAADKKELMEKLTGREISIEDFSEQYDRLDEEENAIRIDMLRKNADEHNARFMDELKKGMAERTESLIRSMFGSMD